MKAITRRRSTVLTCLLPRMTTKYATAATMVIATTALERRSAVSTPVSTASTTRATAATAATM